MKQMLVVLLSVVMATQLFAGVAFADATTVVITESDVTRQAENTPPTDNWVLYTRTAASTGNFVVGPATPPLGNGSLELITPTGSDKVFLFNYDHVDTPLGSIDTLTYATYRMDGGNTNQLPAINIQINPNTPNNDTFATLVFEPVYNLNQQAIQTNVWQTWNAYNGGNAVWWSTRELYDAGGNLVACNPNGAFANTPQCAGKLFVPWSSIVNGLPAAFIVGGIGVNAGSGNGGLNAATDVLAIGTPGNSVVYDFEPYKVATSVDDCKNGGWQIVKRADGSGFKNQGDCIQYVNTGK